MKKILSIALVVVLLAGIAVSGTMAYLTDTDSAVNVMTLGNVKIEQIEQERDENGELQAFTQDKPLYPAVYDGTSIPWADENEWVEAGKQAWKVVADNENVVDKFVTVKNTGKSDAYVRTLIAFEVGKDAVNDPYMHLVCNGNKDDIPVTYEWVKDAAGNEIVIEVDGGYYKVCAFTYTDALSAGETSIPSIKQVYLDKTATNEVCEAYGETFEILALSQAVQTAGFDNAKTALDTAFGAVDATTAAEWFGDVYASKPDIWDGTVPTTKPDTLVVDTAAKTISVNDAAAFAYLNTLVNDANFYDNYGSKWQYTVKLNANIDLNNKDWDPIMLSNFVAFEGNGHTISNLNVSGGNSVGLFGAVTCNDIGVTYVRNFTIDGATVNGEEQVGVVAGNGMQAAVEKVTVKDAVVAGTKYVGGIFGGGNGSANGCTVKDSTITIPDGGNKEAGGLIGYLSNDGTASTVDKVIANNTVENVIVHAPSVASGLVSQPNSSNSGTAVIVIKDNTMKNVTITTNDETASLYVSNNVGNKTVVENNTATGCTAAKK